ncbi:MAG: molybdopterin-dependent oxidoreductase, partial [Dehalococcoidia bacterium]
MVSEQSAQAESEAEPEDSYRQQWKWDKVTWASHCVDCFPGNCPMRAYVKDGIVWREEQAGTFPIVEEGVPDMNPMGCQKGVAWTRLMYGEERLLYPLKRVGERGSGKWKRISWDEAATEIADAILDAIEEIGPESIMGFTGGSIIADMHRGRFLGLVGGILTDTNAEVNDFAAGHYLTWGAYDPVPSIDDTFHAELVLIWFANPVYTRIPHFHYIPEARYNGTEVYTISPDVSPSSKLAD